MADLPETASPTETARRFVQAVAWGEHHVVWDMLGTEAHRVVLGIATSRGMPEPLAARLRDGSASEAEIDQFRGDLVNGFRADLLSIDVDTLEYEVDEAVNEPGSARVILVIPVPNPILGSGLPGGSLELRQEGEDSQWRVDRLIARLAK